MSAFLNPGLLWLLALGAVPIVIHLLNRRRYRTVRWAAQEFLRAAFRKNQKRLRVENLLLLIVRTALILLLVLAVARPLLTGAVAGALTDQSDHYAVLLDNSYSMGLNEGLSSPFERGVREIQRIVAAMGREDSMTLYLTNDDFAGSRPGTPRAVLRDSTDREKLSAVLGRLSAGKPSAGASRLADALAVVADELADQRPGQQVVLVTDFCRRAFESDAPEGAGDAEGAGSRERTLRDLLEEVRRKGARITLLDVGAPDPANAAVLTLAPAEDRPLVERNQEVFAARVANYGPRPLSLDVVFRADGEMKGSTRVDLPPAPDRGRPAEAVATFEYPPLAAGPRSFSAELPADALAADDIRVYAGRVRERLRVLAVDGDPQPDRGLSPETRFLRFAIAPKPDRIEFEAVDYLGFLTRTLENVDLLVLANVERVREDKVRQIEEFVAGGGGLVVFLGDRTDPGLVNRDFWKDGEGLLPAQVAAQPVVTEREQTKVTFDLADLLPHPLLDAIFGPATDPEGFMKALAPKVWGFYPVAAPPSSTVLLRYTDAEKRPALVEKRFGAGRVLLFTTAADLDWSDLPRVMIVPLMHETVYYATRQEPGRANLTPFEAYERDLSDTVVDVDVSTPAGGRVKAAIIAAERGARVLFRDTGDPGLYRAEFRLPGSSAIDAGTRGFAEHFAVNVDAREGDIRRISGDEVVSRYSGIDLTCATTFGGEGAGSEDGSGNEFWKPLAFLVLALLAIEMLIARRFGDYSRKVRHEEVVP